METNTTAAAARTEDGGDCVDHLTGTTLVLLMAAHRKSVKSLVRAMGVTRARVRQVREHGVRDKAHVQDWAEAITGDRHLSWGEVARLYLPKWAERAMRPASGSPVEGLEDDGAGGAVWPDDETVGPW